MDELTLLAVAAVVVVVAVTSISARIGVAAPILLVVVGVALSLVPGVPTVTMDPELILTVVLPLLLYAAAVNMPATDFRRNLGAITALSVVLVVASAFVVGLLVWWLLPDLGFAAAVALGAVVSPPDAVAATSIGKRLGLPNRLVTILEGEGLVNDATALVMLRSAVVATAGAISAGGVLADFGYAVAVAVLVGIVVGWVSIRIRARLEQPVTSTAISLVVPFIAFIPAEHLGASGVLSVVVAGLVTGIRSPRLLSSQARVSERTNWRTVLLLLEHGVFLVLGLQIALIVGEVRDAHLSVSGALWLGVLVTAVLLVVRFVFVAPMIGVMSRQQERAKGRSQWFDDAFQRLEGHPEVPEHRIAKLRHMITRRQADASFFSREGIGKRGGFVIAWSGMRGVVTVAAAQTLPEDLPYRPQLILIAFTVAVLTLVVQGGTLPLLIRVLGIRGSDEEELQRELTRLVNTLTEASEDVLESPTLHRSDGRPFSEEILGMARQRTRKIPETVSTETMQTWTTTRQEQQELQRRLLEAQQDALLDAQASGVYRSQTIDAAQQFLDRRNIMNE
ncbi:cation:proton antiporter [Kocuria tytonis]|uniref:Sodium:proton antiporter n=1 Tax=Kocuria tytonis TaxID=2054280 RepID=A0A495A827_9MICC|nr:sodium:proton antiporter [Kocuria tytonis]RKQ36139.1 sodium:proton antiporter [Kocuria tytonis]